MTGGKPSYPGASRRRPRATAGQLKRMRDLFISYRRSDTTEFVWWLRDHLYAEFGEHRVFRDVESLAPGEPLPAVIEAGVQQCKILLVVIGRGWLTVNEQTGRPRLHEAGDWVRREVELALHAGKEIIPVFGAMAGMPPRDALPESIRELADRLGYQFSDHRETQEQHDWPRLLRRLRGLLAGASAEYPPLLPALCDREPQWTPVENLLEAGWEAEAQRPALVVVPGPAEEAHDAFIRRMEQKSLPELVRQKGVRPRLKVVPLSDRLTSETPAEFAAEFRRRLAPALALSPAAARTNEDLLALMKGTGASLLAVVLEDRPVERPSGPPLFELLAGFWREFPDLPRDLAVACFLCVKFEAPRGGSWLGGWFTAAGRLARTEKALRQALQAFADPAGKDPRLHFRLLQELQSPRLSDIDGWLKQPEVERVTQRRPVPEERRRAVLHHQESCPMDDVLRELDALLQELGRTPINPLPRSSE